MDIVDFCNKYKNDVFCYKILYAWNIIFDALIGAQWQVEQLIS